MQSIISNRSNVIVDSKIVKSVFQVFAGSLFLAMSAQISIPLSFVPLTMQTFAVMMLGLTLGRVKGALSVALYLLESFMGYPVLSGLSVASVPLITLRGGYLFAMVLQAYLTGLLFEKYSHLSNVVLLGSLFSITVLQLSMGAFWLGTTIGFQEALFAGFFPFLAGEFFKSVALLSFNKKS